MDARTLGLSAEEASSLQSLVKAEIWVVRKVANLLEHEQFPPGTHHAKLESTNCGASVTVEYREALQVGDLSTSTQVEVAQLDALDHSGARRALKDASELYAQDMDRVLVGGREPSSQSPPSCCAVPDCCWTCFNYPSNRYGN